jgi:hypothetical protein
MRGPLLRLVLRRSRSKRTPLGLLDLGIQRLDLGKVDLQRQALRRLPACPPGAGGAREASQGDVQALDF